MSLLSVQIIIEKKKRDSSMKTLFFKEEILFVIRHAYN